MAKTEKPDWSPPEVDDSGRELLGGYPANGPARAAAIAAAGRKTDPEGILTPEQIAAFKGADIPAADGGE